MPIAAPAQAVDELDRRVRQQGFKGTLINGHTRGRYLDDKAFWPILECAEALNVPVYLHPTVVDRRRTVTPAAPAYLIDSARYFAFGPIEHRLSTLTPLRRVHPIGLIGEFGLPTGSMLEAEEGSAGGAETHHLIKFNVTMPVLAMIGTSDQWP